MTDITILSLILGSATSFVGLMFAIRSFVTHSQQKAVDQAADKRTLAELLDRVKKLEEKEDD
jgi:hypothetical protein